jgi:DNA-binding response OmpR family regulator
VRLLWDALTGRVASPAATARLFCAFLLTTFVVETAVMEDTPDLDTLRKHLPTLREVATASAALRLLLESRRDIRVVGECGTHDEVLNTLAKCREPIDVVTLDVTMPGGSAARLIQDIVRRNSGTRVVVLTMHEDPSYARMALAAGASAYVVKSATDTELLMAVRTVARGGVYRDGDSPRSRGVNLPTTRQTLWWPSRLLDAATTESVCIVG